MTTTFLGDVTTGPELYAEHIWRFFHADPRFDLHVVATASDKQDDRVHLASKRSGPGIRTYRALEATAQRLLSDLGGNPIVHVNAAHMITPEFAKRARAIVQVNDTEVCQWRLNRPSLSKGLRRNFTLRWRQQRERQVIRNAGLTICNSQHTQSALTQEYGLTDEPLQVIYKAIELQPFQDVSDTRAANQHPSNLTRLLFVGSNWRRKGLDVLLEALGKFDRATEPRFTLSVVGKRPHEREARFFEKLVHEHGLSKMVHFKGCVDNTQMPALLLDHDILVLPSREEALGVAAIEALASGMPVVASRVGGLPEVVDSSECGQLVSPEQPDELAEAIRSVATTCRDAGGIAFRSNAVSRFGTARLKQELAEVYSREYNEC